MDEKTDNDFLINNRMSEASKKLQEQAGVLITQIFYLDDCFLPNDFRIPATEEEIDD